MPRRLLVGAGEPYIVVVSDTVSVSNRFTLQVSEVEIVPLPQVIEDHPTPAPRDWPAAWLVKWRDR